MPQQLNELDKKEVHIAEVVRHGEKIVLPDGMTAKSAIVTLQRFMESEEQIIHIVEDFETFPFDGAFALAQAMEKRYGWVAAEVSYGFSVNPPMLRRIPVAHGKSVQVPWGRFSVPGIEDGAFETSVSDKNDRLIFRVVATVRRKYTAEVNALFQATREALREHSIYKGQAIRITFHNEKGQPLSMPEPQFMDVSRAHPDTLVFPTAVAMDIHINLFTPIERMPECKANGVPTKRGIMLGGRFGTGKTLAAMVAAKKATESGVTFIYCDNANEFAEVMRFAAQYQPAVVFCEDIDKVLGGARDINMDAILNVMDGIEAKGFDIITVLTTNEVTKIEKAMLRPGRLDAVIIVTEPDAEAVAKLIRLYGGRLVDEQADLVKVGKILEGNIPAVVREAVERAKLASIAIQPPGTPIRLTEDALLVAAESMKPQLELLNAKAPEDPHDFQILGEAIGIHIHDAIDTARKLGADTDHLHEANNRRRKERIAA